MYIWQLLTGIPCVVEPVFSLPPIPQLPAYYQWYSNVYTRNNISRATMPIGMQGLFYNCLSVPPPGPGREAGRQAGGAAWSVAR